MREIIEILISMRGKSKTALAALDAKLRAALPEMADKTLVISADDFSHLILDDVLNIYRLFPASNITLENIGFTPLFRQIVIYNLEKNILVGQLALSRGLDNNYMRALVAPLKKTTRLTCIDFSGAELSTISIGYLTEALMENTSVKKLSLSSNKLDDNAITSLTPLLTRPNAVLESLDLSTNQFSERGSKAIAIIIQLNSSLTELNISNNSINTLELGEIADSLHKNATLEKLDIRGSNFSDVRDGNFSKETVLRFAQATVVHPRLTALQMGGHDFQGLHIDALKNFIITTQNKLLTPTLLSVSYLRLMHFERKLKELDHAFACHATVIWANQTALEQAIDTGFKPLGTPMPEVLKHLMHEYALTVPYHPAPIVFSPMTREGCTSPPVPPPSPRWSQKILNRFRLF